MALAGLATGAGAAEALPSAIREWREGPLRRLSMGVNILSAGARDPLAAQAIRDAMGGGGGAEQQTAGVAGGGYFGQPSQTVPDEASTGGAAPMGAPPAGAGAGVAGLRSTLGLPQVAMHEPGGVTSRSDAEVGAMGQTYGQMRQSAVAREAFGLYRQAISEEVGHQRALDQLRALRAKETDPFRAGEFDYPIIQHQQALLGVKGRRMGYESQLLNSGVLTLDQIHDLLMQMGLGREPVRAGTVRVPPGAGRLPLR